MNDLTLGPWQFDSNTRTIYGTPRYGTIEQTAANAEFQGADCNSLNEVCKVHRVSVSEFWLGHTHYPMKVDVVEFFRRRSQANANLIVAAPDLLQALKDFVSITEGDGAVKMAAITAIKKAEGTL